MGNPRYIIFPKFIYFDHRRIDRYFCVLMQERRETVIYSGGKYTKSRNSRVAKHCRDGFTMLNESQRSFGKLQIKLLLSLKITITLFRYSAVVICRAEYYKPYG